jgi:hypothetical protein
MLGGIVETSASFEARSAPRSYPTAKNGSARLAGVEAPATKIMRRRLINSRRGFLLPNFHFHVTAAYAILRHYGVDIGKSDFFGAIPMKTT